MFDTHWWITLIQNSRLSWKSTVTDNHIISAEKAWAGDSEFPSQDEQLHQYIILCIYFFKQEDLHTQNKSEDHHHD